MPRTVREAGPTTQNTAPQNYAFGTFRLDLAASCLWNDDRPLRLKAKALAVLRYLVEHPGRLIAKQELLTAVWPGIVVSEWVLTTNVRQLRRALGDDKHTPRFIATVHGQGYRFVAPVTTAPPVSSFKFQVSGSTPAPSTQHPAPILVGRELELAQLHRWLEKACNGERQLVFVTGEPGIGKSALVNAFLAQAENAEAVWVARGQCVEQFGVGDAYLPVLDALGALSRGPAAEQLREVLLQYAPTWIVQLPWLLRESDLASIQPKIATATQERMLRELAEALAVLTTEQPLVIVLEDLHWSDHATLELLAFWVRQPQPARLLLIGTYRPVEMLSAPHPLKPVMQELLAHRLCTELPMEGLSEPEVAAYVEQRFPVQALPVRLPQVLHQRTGGNPLFLVSLVEDLVAHEQVIECGGRWSLQGEVETLVLSVPDNIRHLVARQRERLSLLEQHLLAAASAAGLEFSVASVAAALAADTVEIDEHCHRLAEQHQFLRPAGIYEWPDGTRAGHYAFIHALYQQLWHEQAAVGRVQQWHRRIGERKEVAYGERTPEIAVELAVHFEQAGDWQRAAHYCEQAAQKALRRFAPHEAIVALHKRIQLLQQLPQTPERVGQELQCQMTLSGALMVVQGYAAPEVEQACSRAHALCQQLGDTPYLGPVTLALHRLYVVRGELLRGHDIAEHLLRFAQKEQDQDLLLVSHVALGTSWLFRGELHVAREHLRQAQHLYEPQRHQSFVLQYGDDPLVASATFEALILALLGDADQAVEKIQIVLTLARGQAYPYSVGFVQSLAGVIAQLRRDGRSAQEHSEAALTLGSEHGVPLFLVMGSVVRGWALARQGNTAEGIAQICQGLATWRAAGAELQRPYFLALLAEAYARDGQLSAALDTVGEALTLAQATEQGWYEAELYRLKGQLTLQSQTSPKQVSGKSQASQNMSEDASTQHLAPHTQAEAEAEACFLKAIEIARQQQAKLLELRAVVSLSRLWQQQGKREETRQTLAKIYGWFSEGFDTVDLQEAKALLKSLSQGVC